MDCGCGSNAKRRTKRSLEVQAFCRTLLALLFVTIEREQEHGLDSYATQSRLHRPSKVRLFSLIPVAVSFTHSQDSYFSSTRIDVLPSRILSGCRQDAPHKQHVGSTAAIAGLRNLPDPPVVGFFPTLPRSTSDRFREYDE